MLFVYLVIYDMTCAVAYYQCIGSGYPMWLRCNNGSTFFYAFLNFSILWKAFRYAILLYKW